MQWITIGIKMQCPNSSWEWGCSNNKRANQTWLVIQHWWCGPMIMKQIFMPLALENVMCFRHIHSTLPIMKKKYAEILLHYRQLFVKGDVIIGEWGIFGVEIFHCYSWFFAKCDFVIGRVECRIVTCPWPFWIFTMALTLWEKFTKTADLLPQGCLRLPLSLGVAQARSSFTERPASCHHFTCEHTRSLKHTVPNVPWW